MKRCLYLGLLSILLWSCNGERGTYEDCPPMLPEFLKVFSNDNARTQSELLMQYAFYIEEELFVKNGESEQIGCALFGDGVFIDSGQGLKYDVNGERIVHDLKIKPGSRSYENFTLLFQWPFLFDEQPLLTEGWHSSKAEELNLPTTQKDNELIGEVTKYALAGVSEWSKIAGKYYYYVGIKKIVISANKPLFGFESGVDISHKFRMVSAPTLLLATFPTFAVTCRIEDKKPTSLVEFNNSLLSAGGYAVKFAEVPAEKYDEITFTVAMDILLPDGGERTLTGSVKVVFE